MIFIVSTPMCKSPYPASRLLQSHQFQPVPKNLCPSVPILQQPVVNLHLARAYLTASDPAFVERTWRIAPDCPVAKGCQV